MGIKLQPGDYVSTEGMTEEQYHAVCKAFMYAGARWDTHYNTFRREDAFMGWDRRDDCFYSHSLRESSFVKELGAFNNKLTIDQILGSDNTEGTKDMTLKEAYKVMQANCGIEVGDTVKVLRKAGDYEMGWGYVWVKRMDQYVGETFKVVTLYHAGIECGSGFDIFPFFVLELVKKAPKLPSPIRISSQYKAEFKEDGSIAVGCQTLDFEMIEKIYLAAKGVKGNE